MRMALYKFGIEKTERQLGRMLQTKKKAGTLHSAFAKIAEKYKLDYIVGRKTTIGHLKKHKSEGYLIILCFYCPHSKEDHYAVLKKIDHSNITMYDPWWGPNRKISRSYFRRVWTNRYPKLREKRWFFAVKKP